MVQHGLHRQRAGLAGACAYNAAKHGVVGLTRTAASEVAQKGVRVNCVMPGVIETPLLVEVVEQLFDGDVQKGLARLGQVATLNRCGQPDEVGNVVSFLLSDEASYVNGAMGNRRRRAGHHPQRPGLTRRQAGAHRPLTRDEPAAAVGDDCRPLALTRLPSARARGAVAGCAIPMTDKSSIESRHIRNFSIIAHVDHGKSTLADRLIQICGGLADREMQSQVLDNMALERERGITIKAQSVTLFYDSRDGQRYQLNLIDTPGHVDFSYEVSRSLAACEGALLVVDAAQGVEAQSVANCYTALEQGLEVVPVLNKIDLPSADPDKVIKEIEEIIGIDAQDAIRVSAKTGENVPELIEDADPARAGAQGQSRRRRCRR